MNQPQRLVRWPGPNGDFLDGARARRDDGDDTTAATPAKDRDRAVVAEHFASAFLPPVTCPDDTREETP